MEEKNADQSLESRKKKVIGEPDEGKPHVRFEAAGDGNQDKVKALMHSQSNRSASPKPKAPFPNPTNGPGMLRDFITKLYDMGVVKT